MIYLNLVKEKLSSLWSMWLVIMLVAIWSIYIQDGYINRDGLLYLKQAYLFAEGNWKEGLAIYPWPFFSILIASFHKLTNLNLQLAAHGVDLALFGLTVLFYLKTLQFIYKQEKQIIFYGGVILLSFIPIMDDYVGMILRDHGLWAGCMMGTFFYFKNLKQYSFKNSTLWQFGFLLAGLFRPEGLVFLVLLPLWNLYQNKTQKLKKLIQDYSLSIFFSILGFFAILISNVDLINFISSTRLAEFLNRTVLLLNQLVKPLPIRTYNEYLSKIFENYSLIITYSVLISVLIFKWIKGVGILHGGLFFYSFFKQKNFKNIYQKHLYFLSVLSFILVSVNLFTVYVLTNRYWAVHWFWIFMLIAPVLLIISNSMRSKKKDILKILVSFYLFFSIVNVLLDANNTNMEMEAGYYLSELTKAGDKSVKLINADRVGYYGGISFQRLIHSTNPVLNSDLIIFKGSDEEAMTAAGLDYQLEKSFTKGQQGVYIFRRKE